MFYKVLIVIGVLLLSFQWTLSQVTLQAGLVREINSNKRPLAGVQIVFMDAKSEVSDNEGQFQLAFQNKEAGDLIFSEKIYKAGYELVNEKDLELLKISSSPNLGVNIILAKEGTVNAAKKEYYNVSDAALRANFEKEKTKLLNQLRSAKRTQKEYVSDLKELQAQFDHQKSRLDALAEKFARINFDDVESLYRDALKLFKEGKIEAAEQKWEAADPIGRLEKRLEERSKIEQAQKDLQRQERIERTGIKTRPGAG